MRKRWLLALVPALAALLLVPSCAGVTPNRDPEGERFPSVRGTALDGKEWRLPEDLEGRWALLLVGYVQGAQFDLDRWTMGVLDADLGVPVLEVPTIEGLVPSLISGWIDDGMRAGIPKQDWPSVVTVYGDADAIVALTGNESPRNGRVLLLDDKGVVRWFSDEGYAARAMLELRDLLRRR